MVATSLDDDLIAATYRLHQHQRLLTIIEKSPPGERRMRDAEKARRLIEDQRVLIDGLLDRRG